MTKKIKYLVFISVCFLTFTSFASSPFSSQKNKPKKSSPSSPAFIQKIINSIAPLQRKIRKNLSNLASKLKKSKSPRTFLVIFFFSFLYGVIHALGPGHGKIVAFSYFASSSDSRLKSGIIAGSSIAFLQAISAILLVSVMYFVLNKTKFISIESTRTVITRVSFGMIFLLGIYLFIDFFISVFKKRNKKKQKINQNKMRAAILSVGIVPCAGTIIILLFTLSLDMLGLGIAMTFFIAAGMALTISLAGIAAISTKKGVFKFLHKKPKLVSTFQNLIKLTGAVIITLFGAIMFIGSL
ncbi:MAG: nickel/cobalt transporter [Elusimicrobiota bacterium]